MREIKGGIQKLSTMKKLLKNVDKGVRIVNLPHLLVQNWTSIHVLDLYNAVKHFLHFFLLTKGGALRNFLGRLIEIFYLLGRVI